MTIDQIKDEINSVIYSAVNSGFSPNNFAELIEELIRKILDENK